MPQVSVIIPTFNRCSLVPRALKSVLEQDHPSFEVIVVDDGSSDGTAAHIPTDGDVKLVVHPSNRGVSAARNTGIRYCSGRFIAFLDSDDYWLPGKLKAQTAFFSRNPSAVACQTDEIWIRHGKRVNPQRRHLKPSGDIFRQSLDLCMVSPSSVMLKKTLLEEIGLFDESIPACEDYDMWLRIACRYPVHLIAQDFSVREGGRPDQLSASFPAMDLFRIRSLLKVLESCPLDEAQYRLVLDTLARKSEIYAAGCIKRGRDEEAAFFLSLVHRASAACGPVCRLPSPYDVPVRILPF
jgi:glycosyltransferase involved in cell wall biosynthesis